MDETQLIEQDIAEYLRRHEHKELLRFVTVGSVDDGKSTLIGRLLHDTHGIYEDQLSAVKRASKTEGIDFSLFTDGLKAEREQGITIDVAYRYFSTEKRKFIIADTPGHVQYTRNMATGASTAHVAIILIDARLGVLQQSRRHAFIASLLGIPELTVCVNKMDLCDFDQKVFDDIRAAFSAFAERLSFRHITFVPVSARDGDNVVSPSSRAPWYSGPTLLTHLETVPIAGASMHHGFRYPVQTVLRPNLDYRAFAGQIAAGSVKKGDEIQVLPSGKKSRVVGIDTFEGEVDTAFAPQSVALRLADEIDISRGDMLIHPQDPPKVAKRFDATLVWLSEKPLDRERSYFLKHTTQYVRASIEHVAYSVNLETLEQVPAERFVLNDIGRATVSCHRPLFFDPYSQSRSTGAFVLIDSITNNTVAAGMIVGEPARAGDASERARGGTQVSALERRERLGQGGLVVRLSGPASAAKQELAYTLERRLFDRGKVALVVALPAQVPGLAKLLADSALVAIYAGDAPANLEAEVGSERFLDVPPASADADVEDVAESVCRDLERRGLL
jgi:bifunctional enzyme CysN/CysC/sulfate adenylyltransferase subunit 1